MNDNKYERVSNIEQQHLAYFYKFKHPIVNIFELKNSSLTKEFSTFIFVFQYEDTILCQKFTHEQLYDFRNIPVEDTIQEVIEEYNILCALPYRRNKFSKKFKNFIIEQLSFRYAPILDLYYQAPSSHGTLGFEIHKFIEKYEINEYKDIDFKELYNNMINNFTPQKGIGFLSMENEDGNYY